MIILAKLQQVEIVNDGSWWEQNVGSIVVAVAAIAAAALAAYVAIRNHSQQLEHDRQMRNQEATRGTIDRAVEMIGQAIRKTALFGGATTALELLRDRLDDDTDEPRKGGQEVGDKSLDKARQDARSCRIQAYESAREVDIQKLRLTIRLGSEHRILDAYEAARKSLDAWQDSISVGIQRNRSDEEKAETKKLLDDFSRDRTSFDQACYDWMND